MKTRRKTKVKRILSLLLALLMIISTVPLSGMSVFAAEDEDFEYEILDDGTAEITGYNGTASDLVIPSKIDGYEVTSIRYFAFEGCTFLTDITIPNNVTSIGSSAFAGCTSLTDIIIPNGVTSIEDCTFQNCTSLTDINIPNSVTLIKYEAFSGCTSLAGITIPNGVTSIEYDAFKNCVSLTEIAVPSSVTSIERSVFDGCISLKNIKVASDNSVYSDIDGVLFNKDKTELIRYPEGRNDSNYMIPYGVVRIGDDAFSHCESLTSIIIPDSVITIGYRAFENCTSLTDITIPNSVTSIEGYAFSYCTALLDVVIPDSVTEIGLGIFSHCSSLISAKISNNITYLDGFANCTSLKSITIPDSVTYIERYAFYNCTSLSEIDIPDSVKYICEYAFDNTAYYNNNSNWEDDVLYCGKHLIKARANITGNYKMKDDTVSIAERAFQDCSKLTGVIISDKVTFITNAAFNSCKALKSVVIPDTVTNIGWGSFANCTSLESIHIPNSVTVIDLYAFSGCTSLKTVIIPDTVSSLTQEVFANCTSLTHIFIPESVTDINSYAFSDCPSLTIYGYAGTAAETYAKENGFKFIALDKKTDETTGISVSEKELNIIPDGAQLKTEKLSVEENKIFFDISLVKDGAEVQPNGEVAVKIPVHEEMDTSLLKVYREEANGTYTDMKAYFANGYMIFTTDHFSKYVLTTEELSSALPGDINSDGKVTAIDARWVLQIAAGIRQVTEEERKSVDFNKDGKVTAIDARWVLQAAAGIRVL